MILYEGSFQWGFSILLLLCNVFEIRIEVKVSGGKLPRHHVMLLFRSAWGGLSTLLLLLSLYDSHSFECGDDFKRVILITVFLRGL